jgi:hypothetical protein
MDRARGKANQQRLRSVDQKSLRKRLRQSQNRCDNKADHRSFDCRSGLPWRFSSVRKVWGWPDDCFGLSKRTALGRILNEARDPFALSSLSQSCRSPTAKRYVRATMFSSTLPKTDSTRRQVVLWRTIDSLPHATQKESSLGCQVASNPTSQEKSTPT